METSIHKTIFCTLFYIFTNLAESSIFNQVYAVQCLLVGAVAFILRLVLGLQIVYRSSKGSEASANSYNGICSTNVPSRLSTISFTKLVLFFFMITHDKRTSASTSKYCAREHTAELGEQGIIDCNFPYDFQSVVWFDDVSANSSFVISCVSPCNVKKGPGFINGEYDVFHNGSLCIPRVEARHHRNYEVVVYITATYFEKFIVTLKVIALPIGLLLTSDGNDIHQEYYHSINGMETLTCSVNAARPPVQLEWIEHTPNSDIVLELIENITDQNENGTFKSLVSVGLASATEGKLMTLLVCRANWKQQAWKRETKILVDNSGLELFSNEPNNVLYFEINRRAEIRCEGSSGFVNLWKRVLPNKSAELIGFSSDSTTEIMTTSQGIRISSEGSLIFPLSDIGHEGTYVCLYSYGMQTKVYLTDVTILIPPSPPYIQIEGCGDVDQSCTLQGSDHHQLVCSVVGVRPVVTLEWIASNNYEGKISFLNKKSVVVEHGETSDISLSAEYKIISQHGDCENYVFIKCRLQGPVSHIVKAERTIMLTHEACEEDQNEESGGSVTLVLVLAVWLLFTVICALLIAAKVVKKINCN